LVVVGLVVVVVVVGHPRCSALTTFATDMPQKVGAICTHIRKDEVVARVIQIRNVPDDVHAALVKAAEAEKLSLNRYVLRELEHLARRAEGVERNARVITETRARVLRKVARENILAALQEGREE